MFPILYSLLLSLHTNILQDPYSKGWLRHEIESTDRSCIPQRHLRPQKDRTLWCESIVRLLLYLRRATCTSTPLWLSTVQSRASSGLLWNLEDASPFKAEQLMLSFSSGSLMLTTSCTARLVSDQGYSLPLRNRLGLPTLTRHRYDPSPSGDFVVTAPMILGHESAGIIVAGRSAGP